SHPGCSYLVLNLPLPNSFPYALLDVSRIGWIPESNGKPAGPRSLRPSAVHSVKWLFIFHQGCLQGRRRLLRDGVQSPRLRRRTSPDPQRSTFPVIRESEGLCFSAK